ncbi:Saccharopine dehydrogenase-domain-containing protein [Gautieria morchelliformis]|nr:Saccharopine dehydrogenase-domain-containing protein [Gautieria morchelliformis]
MSGKTDILVIGATGFTGHLVTRQLNNHRDRASFTFALVARSRSKLAALAADLDLSAQIPLITLDVTQVDDVEKVVKTTKVVINTAGPYWLWGTPVVRACARNGIHYIDISGETPWIKDIIDEFDYLASKTHSVIVPSCGFDSIPSDLSAYLSVRTLKQRLGLNVETARSVTAHKFQGGISGGTLRTLYTHFEMVPRQKAIASLQDHALSPASGAASPPIKILYSMPYVTPRIFGSFLLMSPINRSMVLRTRGLLEVNPSMRSLKYGPEFNYEEFLVAPNRLAGAIMSLTVLALGFCLSASSTVRWLFKRLVADNVHGPSEKTMQEGFLKTTNVTSSVPSSTHPETVAKTVIRIRGDPGYLCTSVMLTESAIALLDTSKLTPLAKQGGVLTSVSAFGDELVTRLEATGRFEFETNILET